ncbi:hypothetical protein NTGBS_880040 [Candidatus Nitrotoga sp. BS]|nr:hypothetical protein NTGBS_880040 [Candidatus Nitrotoga sp. BS]
MYMPVFDRIEMNVIDRAGKNIFIAKLVFTESPLPDSRFAIFENSGGHTLRVRGPLRGKTVPTLHS